MTPKQIKIELKKYGLTDADIKDMGDAELQAKLDDLKLEFGAQEDLSVYDDDSTTDFESLKTNQSGDDAFSPPTIPISVICTLTCVIKDPCRVDGAWYKEGDSVRMVAGERVEVGYKTREYLSKQRVLA